MRRIRRARRHREGQGDAAGARPGLPVDGNAAVPPQGAGQPPGQLPRGPRIAAGGPDPGAQGDGVQAQGDQEVGAERPGRRRPAIGGAGPAARALGSAGPRRPAGGGSTRRGFLRSSGVQGLVQRLVQGLAQGLRRPSRVPQRRQDDHRGAGPLEQAGEPGGQRRQRAAGTGRLGIRGCIRRPRAAPGLCRPGAGFVPGHREEHRPAVQGGVDGRIGPSPVAAATQEDPVSQPFQHGGPAGGAGGVDLHEPAVADQDLHRPLPPPIAVNIRGGRNRGAAGGRGGARRIRLAPDWGPAGARAGLARPSPWPPARVGSGYPGRPAGRPPEAPVPRRLGGRERPRAGKNPVRGGGQAVERVPASMPPRTPP